MSVVINTNVDSLRIQANLTKATSGLSKAMKRMSTGLKVLDAKDDAAGNVIAAKMTVQMDGNKIAQNNVQNGIAMLSTAEGHLDVVQENLSRIRDLTLQAKNGTYSSSEIQAMQDEVAERIKEIGRISESSKYSSLQLFGDTDDEGELEGLAKNGANFQVGANATANDEIEAHKDLFQTVKFYSLIDNATDGFTDEMITALKGVIQDDDIEVPEDIKDDADKKAEYIAKYKSEHFFNLTEMSKMSAGVIKAAINALDHSINNLTNRKSIIGSAQNRLDSALETLTTQYENLSSAKSIIMDADVAEEASTYTQENILQQVSTALLAQANQAPSIALSLI